MTDNLKALALAASVINNNERAEWYTPGELLERYITYAKTARFIAAASPEVVLALIAEVERLQAQTNERGELAIANGIRMERAEAEVERLKQCRDAAVDALMDMEEARDFAIDALKATSRPLKPIKNINEDYAITFEDARASINAAKEIVKLLAEIEHLTATLYKERAEHEAEVERLTNETADLKNRLHDEKQSVRNLEARIAELEAQDVEPVAFTYSSKQATKCACCGVHKHTPLRVDFMGGYVCLTCIDMRLEVLDDTATMYAKQVSYWIGKHDALLEQQLSTSVPPEWTDESVIKYCVSRGIIAAQAAPAAQERPVNCGTGYCSCIECPFEPPAAPAAREPYDKTEMNAFVTKLYQEKSTTGQHGFYETLYHVVHKAIERVHGIGTQEQK